MLAVNLLFPRVLYLPRYAIFSPNIAYLGKYSTAPYNMEVKIYPLISPMQSTLLHLFSIYGSLCGKSICVFYPCLLSICKWIFERNTLPGYFNVTKIHVRTEIQIYS